MITLVLAEAGLETIPEQLWSKAPITRHAKLRRKHPRLILLDRSYHHSTMKTLASNEKRGRPDIVHYALLEALGSPLNKEKLLTVYVHTVNDYVIWVDAETRLPRNYNRFVSLIEQLFEFGQIPPEESEKPLLKLQKQTLPQLIHGMQASNVLALSRLGKPVTLEAAISKIAFGKKPAVLIGGFAKGHFTGATAKLADEIVCIDNEMLETWTVVSRVIYEFERVLSLPKKRLEQ